VVQIWQAHQADDDVRLPEHVDQASHALILRPRWKATVLPLEPASHAALAHLADGGELGSALQTAMEIDPDFDSVAQLRQWLDNGVFTEAVI
jgi:hypothetical protein